MVNKRIVSGHQPSYLPWLGFFHKASLCDIYIYMDDVQYLVGDWNNRNQVKSSSGKAQWLTVPVDLKNSKSMLLRDIVIKDETNLHPDARWAVKHFKTLQGFYGKCPYFKEYRPYFEHLFLENNWVSLSELNFSILKMAFETFKLDCQIVNATEQGFTKAKSDLILEHAQKFSANMVVTGTFGKDYIDVEKFASEGIKIYFQEYEHPTYTQRFGDFIPYMSFVDLLFNEGAAAGKEIIMSNNITKEDLCKTLN